MEKKHVFKMCRELDSNLELLSEINTHLYINLIFLVESVKYLSFYGRAEPCNIFYVFTNVTTFTGKINFTEGMMHRY